jgi:hypothetical protein
MNIGLEVKFFGTQQIGITTKLILVTKIGKYKDGGTEYFRDSKGKKYFIDGRINSLTKGKVYDRYPDEKGSTILNVVLATKI